MKTSPRPPESDAPTIPTLDLREDKEGVVLAVRVKPRARRNGVDGQREGALVVAVTAAPIDGAANSAVIEVLSAVLLCSKSSLTIVRGHKSRDKMVLVPLSKDEIRHRLSAQTR